MQHLSILQKDKKLYGIISKQKPYALTGRDNLYLYLCSSIISQQLSTIVADVIYGRFLALYGKKVPTAKQILATPYEKLRSIGLSNAKANYVHNVCRFFIEQKISDASLRKMEDEDFISFITQIKGVGRWTAEMILMFALEREDVFAVDDLGIQQSMTKLYKLDAADKKLMKEKMIRIADKWKPYRTYACKYLWGWKDG
jgi:DNA-3-methyladenine glycosylase II